MPKSNSHTRADNRPDLTLAETEQPGAGIIEFLMAIGINDENLLSDVRALFSQVEMQYNVVAVRQAIDSIRNFPSSATVDQSADADSEVVSENGTALLGKSLDRITVPSIESLRAAPNSQLRSFGEYEIIDEIAKGGMGVVFKARQKKLNRLVALKVIESNGLSESSVVKRFYVEAQAAAGLNHPGIVPVYDVGEASGCHFYSMSFVDGSSLAERVKNKGPLDPREAARLIKEAANAVDYAHHAGIIHRDIKPHNLLIDRDGKLQVADFGLAKLKTGDSELTSDGQVLGTPAYMPPEQAEGTPDSVGITADVYSLGATFYFLITGRPPFDSATVQDTLRQVLDKEPVAPRKLDNSIPRDLETICLKSLSKQSSRRYPSASELADDLERWLSNEPILARRVGNLERAWKWCKRKPVISGVALAFLLCFSLGSGVLWERLQASRASGLVESLGTCESNEVPGILSALNDYKHWAEPRLLESLAIEQEHDRASRKCLHLKIALAGEDTSIANELVNDLLVAEIKDIGNIRQALSRSIQVDKNRLWQVFRGDSSESVAVSNEMQFRAGLALARMDSYSLRWQSQDYEFLVDQLINANVVHYSELWKLLEPVKPKLVSPLEEIFYDIERTDSERLAAASTLSDFLSDDADRLLQLMLASNAAQFRLFFDGHDKISTAAQQQQLLNIVNIEPSAELTGPQRISLGRRRANAAIALLRRSKRSAIFNVLRYDNDPEAMTQFIYRCQKSGVAIRDVIECLEAVDKLRGPLGETRQKIDDRAMYALLLILGDYARENIPKSKSSLISRLEDIYAHDPSAGVHSAAGWLLRRWGEPGKVRRIDETVTPYDPSGFREWYVEKFDATEESPNAVEAPSDSLYLTMIVFQPEELVGSSSIKVDEKQSMDKRPLKRAEALAVCDRELTYQQYQMKSGSVVRTSEKEESLDLPAVGINWLDSVNFCNWLNERSQISPESQPVSQNDTNGRWQINTQRPGFRPLTAEEWKFVCASGCDTAYSFGSDVSLLSQYAWYVENSQGTVKPGGELRPNCKGLFDMHGNLFEWCFDPAPTENLRIRLGGGWDYSSRSCYIDANYHSLATDNGSYVGFRVAEVPFSKTEALTPGPSSDSE